MALLPVGNPAPNFKAQNLTGPEYDLEKVKGNRVVVLVFPPDQINPAMTSQTKGVYDKHKGNVDFVVMLRQVPSVAMAKAFLMQFGVTFPVLYDPKQEIYKLYNVENPAVVYVIGKDGNIANAQEMDPKALNAAALESAISSAVAS